MYNHGREVELGYQIQVRAKVGREKGAYCALIACSRYLIGENGHQLLPLGFLGSYWQPRSSLEYWRGLNTARKCCLLQAIGNQSQLMCQIGIGPIKRTTIQARFFWPTRAINYNSRLMKKKHKIQLTRVVGVFLRGCRLRRTVW